MDNYLSKCYELHEKGKTNKEIIENIYINYSSIFDNDKIYEYKKIISEEFNVSLKDIKLIGSSHTKFSLKDGGLQEREEVNDFDFAIINSSFFNYCWSIVNNDKNQIFSPKAWCFNNALLKGKIHPLYLNKRESLYKMIKEKMERVNSEKKSSICIYAYESAFINNLCEYLESDFIDYFRNKKNTELEVKQVKKDGFAPLKKIGE